MEKVDILRAMKQLGQHDVHFQTRDIRKHLKVESSDRPAGTKIYNTLKGALGDGVITEVRGTSKRNKYYRVLDNEKLKKLTAWRTGAPNGGSGTAADRLTRIESAVHSIEERLEQVDSKLNHLLEFWS